MRIDWRKLISGSLRHYQLAFGAVVLLLVIIVFFWVRSAVKDNYVSLAADDRIDLTPTQIQAIKDIGEWEFLAVSAEEMVDTVRKGFFTDDELVRIYYGTLRLGIDMHQLRDDAITVHGDTIEVVLPKVRLLDDDFIDEARTKSFYESGKWDNAAREALYQKARRQMLRTNLTPATLETAQTNAHTHLTHFFHSFHFPHVLLTFE